jgi:ABC-type bacteriocin/lantibiotic exporter with double-glycine peptidase domain
LIILSIAVAALSAAPLYFQQEIINGLTYEVSQRQLLFLSALYAVAIAITIFLKFLLQYRSALLGEDMVRRIRSRILSRRVQAQREGASAGHADGTVVSMLTGEAENIGLFTGGAVTTPLVEIGTLASILIYITLSEPTLGLLILALVVPQGVIVAAIQRSVDGLVKRRLELLRTVADQSIDGEQTRPDERIRDTIDELFHNRRRVHILKLSSKAAQNAIGALGVVGVLALGGWLVLRGETGVGTVVAALSGLTRFARPWSNLVKFYRELNAIRVRFGLLRDVLE